MRPEREQGEKRGPLHSAEDVAASIDIDRDGAGLLGGNGHVSSEDWLSAATGGRPKPRSLRACCRVDQAAFQHALPYVGTPRVYEDLRWHIRTSSYTVFFMTNRRELPKPTEGELELLTILWDRGEATVRELFDAVNTRRPIVYTGVLKLLQIMTDKGLVERNETERAHVYRSAVAKEETQQRFMREISDRFFAGSAGKLALRALEMEAASEEDLNEIRKLLRRKREK